MDGRSLDGVLNSPEQQSGVMWQQASRIIEENVDILLPLTSLDGEDYFLHTQSVSPAETSYSFRQAKGKAGEIYDHKYALAARVNGFDTGYKPGMPLYLIMDDNFSTPLLMFDRQAAGLIILDGSFSSVADAYTYVPNILNTVSSNCVTEKRKIAAQEARKRTHRIVATCMAVSLAGLGGGAAKFVDYRHDRAVEEQERRDAFDATGVSVSAEPVGHGIAYVRSNPNFFTDNTIPSKSGDESLEHPRQVSIKKGCKSVTSLNLGKQTLQAVTDAPPESIFVAVNSNGNAQVCSFATGEDQDSELPTYHVAFEVDNL